MGDKAATSQNASPTTTSVHIPHKQPVMVGYNRTPPIVLEQSWSNASICRPLSIPCLSRPL
jgi:hypothetical protein